MPFTSLTFIFYFLTSLSFFYIFINRFFPKYTKYLVLIYSFIFYLWNGLTAFILMTFYAFCIWLFGELISKTNDAKRKAYLILSIIIIIIFLAYFKYNSIFSDIKLYDFKSIIIPLGISYITFTSISYIVDVFNKKAKTLGLGEFFLYVFFFPKVASGPIALHRDFSKSKRKTDLENSYNSIRRIIIGFAKKALIADYFGYVLSTMPEVANMDSITAILSIILYSFQLYFDFLAYTDIAIGISNLFGYDLEENFNMPYISSSITEFWRRWHISLGKFFREYIYIPLGGNRKGQVITLFNLMIVFLLTGIWHGNGLNYILWGFSHGLIIIFERLLKDNKIYNSVICNL